MPKTEKLSLIIPCYNEEKTLREIVERVLQIRRDWLELELVIVDDCSRDASWEVEASAAGCLVPTRATPTRKKKR